MGQLTSQFSREDIDTLVDAMGDWELLGNQEFHLLNVVRNIPVPEEEDPSFPFIKQLKDHFRAREREITSSRQMRQEKAVFLKAKLLLVKQDIAADQVFDMAAAASHGTAAEPVSENNSGKVPAQLDKASEAQRHLELAEYFIKDMGVWSYYEQFLAERQQE